MASYFTSLGTSTTTAQTDGLPADTIIGTPYQDITEWDGQQTAADDCDIRSQQFIIEQFTGQKLSEQALEQEAQSHGWYHPGNGGTPIDDMSKLLQDHGIASTTTSNATIQQLATQLEDGHKVIAAVNGEDLWMHDPSFQGQVSAPTSQTADHAVVVSGIDTSDPNNPMVLISDPGTGEPLARYSLSDFMQAWQTSGDTMVATNSAVSQPGAHQSGSQHSTTPTDQTPATPTHSDPTPQNVHTPALPSTTDTPPQDQHSASPSTDPFSVSPDWWNTPASTNELTDPHAAQLFTELEYLHYEYAMEEAAIIEEYQATYSEGYHTPSTYDAGY